MSSVFAHYETLLAEHYSWMFNQTFSEKVAEQRGLLEEFLRPQQLSSGALAIDLGAGPGFQSIALAEIGFTEVISVDTSAFLLRELDSHSAHHPIRTIQAEIGDLSRLVPPAKASAVVCMGDTLTHLASRAAVQQLFADTFRALVSGGTLVLSFRDLTATLEGLDRFIPVRSDASRIMTCFLEYEASEIVRVHDLIHINQPTGWTLHKSSYPKLRLSSDWIAAQLRDTGFTISSQRPAGRLLLIAAQKP